MLQARAGLQKRQIGKGAGGFDLGALLQSLGGAKANSNAPESKVAEVQEETAVLWPGSKRAKIRYGPYRIPPISVSWNHALRIIFIIAHNFCRRKTWSLSF